MGVIECSYGLGEGLELKAYSIDPGIDESQLKSLIEMSAIRPGKNKDEIVVLEDRVDSFKEINFQGLVGDYEVPEFFKVYREALGLKLDSFKREDGSKMFFNGSVAVVDEFKGRDIKLRRGGYYDFMATQLESIPGDLCLDYPKKLTVRELMNERGIKNEERARYLAFAYLMLTDKGKEIHFVQRAPNMGIASNCIALPGSTPEFSHDFFKKDFDFEDYYKDHVAREMYEEYSLSENEFKIGRLYLLDDKNTVPHLVIQVETRDSTKELAERIYGKEKAIKEHPFLFCISRESIPEVINRFSLFPPSKYAIGLIAN